MSSSTWDGVIDYVRRATSAGEAGGATDGQLLTSFVAHRDPRAFEAILRRHGPMVLGVCRRVLHHAQDAEDAFQATFLVLVGRAGSVAPRGMVGSWLYGVAYRTALAAKRAAARRRAKERQAPPKEPPRDDPGHELRQLIEQELSRLPDKYRSPILLCELEGKTLKEAAHHLGWREGTLAGRLSRARRLLGKRLARHGPLLAGGPAALALARRAAAARVPPVLLNSTLKVGTETAVRPAAAAAISAPVAALVEGVSKAMYVTRLTTAAVVVLAATLLGLGLGAMAHRLAAAESGPAPQRTLREAGPDANAPAPVPGRAFAASGAGETAAEANLPAEGAGPVAEPALPGTPPPVQVLAVTSRRGYVTITMAFQTLTMEFELPRRRDGARIDLATTTARKEFKLEDIRAYDTKGRQVAGEDLAKRLANEVLALGSRDGKKVDPLHLRLVKEGTLILVFPPLQAGPACREGGLVRRSPPNSRRRRREGAPRAGNSRPPARRAGNPRGQLAEARAEVERLRESRREPGTGPKSRGTRGERSCSSRRGG
jgi:RNA polymerase sigma factor (sigma-70 family)